MSGWGQPPQQQAQPGWGAPPQQQAQPGWGAPPPPIAPPVDQLREWFNAFDTDRSNQISALELKQCMERAGYQFSPETCKMMVNMFDRDGTGQISFDEFQQLHSYIMQMQSAFHQVDSDRSGKLEGNELHRALETSGYRLSPQTFGALFKKFDRHRKGSLGFDGYIELCVFVGTVRNVFATYDVNRTGNATFSFDTFVAAANRTNFL